MTDKFSEKIDVMIASTAEKLLEIPAPMRHVIFQTMLGGMGISVIHLVADSKEHGNKILDKTEKIADKIWAYLDKEHLTRAEIFAVSMHIATVIIESMITNECDDCEKRYECVDQICQILNPIDEFEVSSENPMYH